MPRRNSDEEILALQRELARQPASTPARVALLRALLRVGRVDPWVVRAAALVGHDAASLVGLPALDPVKDVRLTREDGSEARRRRWDLGSNNDSGKTYVFGLQWYDEPHETGPDEDDHLDEEERDLRARQRVLDDARLGDPLSIKTLLILRRHIPANSGPNPEYPLVLLGSDDEARPGALSEPLGGWLKDPPLSVYRMTDDEGVEDRGAAWLLRLARPVLERLADDVFLELLDQALGLPVLIRNEGHDVAVERIRLWAARPRAAWFELLPQKLREAVGVRDLDPANVPDDKLRLTSYAWPGGYELFYLASETPNGETAVICHRCANTSSTPWTIRHWASTENESSGEDAIRCDTPSCGRVIVASEAANDLTLRENEIVRREIRPQEQTWCEECRQPKPEGTTVVTSPARAGLVDVFCDEGCLREFLAKKEAPQQDDEEGAEPAEPSEGDLVTDDHRHFRSQGDPRGRVVVEVPEDEDWRPHVRAYMERTQYFPNVWWVSDHGNWHMLSMGEGE